MTIQISDYIDALRYEDAYTRLHEATRLIVGPKALVKAGTDEYNELAKIRLDAKREIMGYAPTAYKQGFSTEASEHNYQETMKAIQ